MPSADRWAPDSVPQRQSTPTRVTSNHRHDSRRPCRRPIDRASVSAVEIGEARGWNVRPLDSGDWAWTAWIGADGRSGVEPTEAEAESAAQRELESMASDAAAGAQSRRELPVRDDRDVRWDPQA
jgi:hypothetical protein